VTGAVPRPPGSVGHRVLVLCDAASRTGLGHLVRSMALAAELTGRGSQVHVLLRQDSLPAALPVVAAAGATVATGSWGQAPDLVRRLGATVVVDSYRVDGPGLTALHDACRTVGEQLLVIDDLGDRELTADLVLNQNLLVPAPSYPGAVAVLAGPRYALLRPAFGRHRAAGLASAKRLPDRPEQVFVLFGGTDAADMAGTAARAALHAFPAARVRVVAPVTPPPPGLRDPRVTVLPRLDEVHAEMLAADLVLSAGGTTLWELCCLARAAAVVAVADNQVPTYDAMVAAGHVLPAGRAPGSSVELLAERLARLTAEPGTLRRTALSAAAVTDGLGARRVADALVG
jgi:spore coat polysaccharide biosynthesis predicted glycosyltransferase SpsG